MLFKMVVPNGCVSVTYVLVCVQLHHVALSALLINRWRCRCHRFCVDHCYQHLRHRRWLVWLSMIVVLARMIPSVRYLQVSDTCCMMRAMCDSMSYFSSDASDTGYGQVANPATMDSILMLVPAAAGLKCPPSIRYPPSLSTPPLLLQSRVDARCNTQIHAPSRSTFVCRE